MSEMKKARDGREGEALGALDGERVSATGGGVGELHPRSTYLQGWILGRVEVWNRHLRRLAWELPRCHPDLGFPLRRLDLQFHHRRFPFPKIAPPLSSPARLQIDISPSSRALPLMAVNYSRSQPFRQVGGVSASSSGSV